MVILEEEYDEEFMLEFLTQELIRYCKDKYGDQCKITIVEMENKDLDAV